MTLTSSPSRADEAIRRAHFAQPEMDTFIVLQLNFFLVMRSGKMVPWQLWIGDPRKLTQTSKMLKSMDVAWEWLRRDANYQSDFRNLEDAQRLSGTTETFRQHWGLSFRS